MLVLRLVREVEGDPLQRGGASDAPKISARLKISELPV